MSVCARCQTLAALLQVEQCRIRQDHALHVAADHRQRADLDLARLPSQSGRSGGSGATRGVINVATPCLPRVRRGHARARGYSRRTQVVPEACVLKWYPRRTQWAHPRAGWNRVRLHAWRRVACHVARRALPPPRDSRVLSRCVTRVALLIARCDARPLKLNLREVRGDEDSLGGVPPDRVHAVVVQDHRALACGTSKR